MATSTTYNCAEDGVTLRIAPESSRLWQRLTTRRKKKVSFDSLPSDERDLAYAVAELRTLGEIGMGLRIEPDHVWMSHDLVAELDGHTASVLALPPVVDLTFRAGISGALGSSSFRLDYRWERGGVPAVVSRVGAILSTDRGRRRIPRFLLNAIMQAEEFEPGGRIEDHWLALARYRACLSPGHEADLDFALDAIAEGGTIEGVPAVEMSRLLEDLHIDVVDAVSISPFETPTGLDFEIVPFSRETLQSLDGPPSEADAVTTGDDLARFQADFRRRGAFPAYKIGDNRFVAVDKAAVPVLRLLSDKQQAPAQERDAFVRNPRPDITRVVEGMLRDEAPTDDQEAPQKDWQRLVDDVAEPLFVETEEFSTRVVGIGRWEPPVLPMAERAVTTWLPEVFPDEQAERLSRLDVDQLDELANEIETGMQRGEREVSAAGETVPATEASLAQIRRLIEGKRRAAGTEKKAAAQPEDTTPIVVITKENFEEVAWAADLVRRGDDRAVAVPQGVRADLMSHQVKAFEWMVAAWRRGLPGVLNADEQGLGKTLQSLAFLRWLQDGLREGPQESRRPILIVAPTSLLENWEAEVQRHLDSTGLGALHRLYGSRGRIANRDAADGIETDDGELRLNLTALTEAVEEGRGAGHWLLTTYTTLRNYQHSLARLRFSVLVFDEIQTLKNPASLTSAAARAMNADFRVGLTGTPVENRTEDLWAIMDQIATGSLGSLKEFAAEYGRPTHDSMRVLHRRVFAGAGDNPPLGIRRMKTEVISELPPKVRIPHPRLMPPVQARAYDEARLKLTPGARGGALKALQHIRSTSTHPADVRALDDDAFVAQSARVQAAVEVLDWIRDKGERAIVFIEHRRVQHRFAEFARLRYGLDRVDVINGDTPITQRLTIVNRFQLHLARDGGFDLLVLGPKAAGTGLTITAANHVVHLSRWWNPAVEEQCNDRTHRIGQLKPVTVHVPLAIHPEYLEQSFDCLLQDLMRRKRGLASTILWPEGDTTEDVAELQERLMGAQKGCSQSQGKMTVAAVEAALRERSDLIAEPVAGTGLVRLSTIGGGASVVIQPDGADRPTPSSLAQLDAALCLTGEGPSDHGLNRPASRLLGHEARLWLNYVSPF